MRAAAAAFDEPLLNSGNGGVVVSALPIYGEGATHAEIPESN
jgi:hypothetical protein